MGKLVYIMGKSGTGKSRSMKEIPADQFGLINLEGKDLPFGKNAPAFKVERVVCDKASDIVDAIKRFSRKYNIVVVDDFQTLMTNEFMRRSAEAGYQKWTDIGKHAWEVAEAAKEVPDEVIVYVLCHTEENDNGGEKIKTLGKLLDQNVVLESKSTIVLKTGVEDGKYFFCTQNNGKDTVKSPEGMFPTYAVNNDLKYVDDCIRNYYDLPGAKSDTEMAAEHATASQDGVKPSSGRKSRKKEENATEGTTEATGTVRKTRTREQVQADNDKKMQDYVEAQNAAIAEAAGDREEIPFDEAVAALEKVPEPELEKVPRRTRATRSQAQEPEDSDILKEDTFFYIPETDNYKMKHAGDKAPEGGQVITEQEYKDAVVRIATQGRQQMSSASATTASDPLDGAMNPTEPRTRRRRTRG